MTNQIWLMYYFLLECRLFPWRCKLQLFALCRWRSEMITVWWPDASRKKDTQNRERRRVRASSKNPRGKVDIWNNNRDHNTLLSHIPPSFLPLLSFSPIRPSSIALACVLLPLSRLSLKISGGGPLIASLISHVRRLRGFTGDVELLQIITCLFPFPPLLHPSILLSLCSPIYPSHSLSHDLMINYGWEFENKSFFANQNEISPHSRNYSMKMMLLMSFCCQGLACALI